MIPVVDLRVKFGLEAVLAERTCIVVVQVALTPEQNVQMGLIVDSVEEVTMLSEAEIEPTPEFGTSINTEYIVGMAKVKGQVKMLLDIDRVVSTDAIRGMTQAL